jgi:hypothetical protein
MASAHAGSPIVPCEPMIAPHRDGRDGDDEGAHAALRVSPRGAAGACAWIKERPPTASLFAVRKE